MTDETYRRHGSRLMTIDATETTMTQLDVRVDASAVERISFPVEANTWLGSDGRDVLWLGPDEWLVVGPPGTERAIIEEVERALAGIHHSVVDVSSARAVFELASEDRHELLSMGCGLDLHPRSWRDGTCAQTLLARVPVILQEREGATRVFVRPSFAGYLIDWLLDAAAAPRVTEPDTPALRALDGTDLTFEVVRTQRARSAEESAALQGVELGRLLRTIVVRRGANDYVFVLVPGGREIDWKKLRAHLGVSRLSLPDADEAKTATGYERGAITPFGSATAWPVIADVTIASSGAVAIGGGGHSINLHVDGGELVAFLGAEVADVTKADERAAG